MRTTATKMLLAAGVLLLASVPPARAAVITYTEVIENTGFLIRDLSRTRTLGDGSAAIITSDDPTIIAENAVSDTWGNINPLLPLLAHSLNHIFVPVAAVTSYLSASVTIQAFGATGLDLVFVDFPIPLGVLDGSGT